MQDNNIIGYAQNAASMYNTKKGEEEGFLNEYLNKIEKNIPSSDNKVFVGGTYEGTGGKIIATSDYKITLYNNEGRLIFENIQAEEIPAPEGVENPNDYSKFFKIITNGQTILSGLSKDHSVIYTSDGNIYYLLYDKPKVYSATNNGSTVHWIQAGERKGVVAIIYNGNILAYNTIVEECNNLKGIDAYSNSEIINNGYEYSKVAYNNAHYDLVYCPNINKWIYLYSTKESANNQVLRTQIKSELIIEENTTLTQEQINSFIAAAID